LIDRLLVYKKTNGRCWYCGRKLNINLETILNHIPEESKYQDGIKRHDFSVDHVVPNGKNNIENLVPCCKGCNASKHVRTLEHFRKIMWHKRFKKKFGIDFNEEQIGFLKGLGFKLPTVDQKYIFYFEKEGLK
jgi:5-methylcytosine-specific restriction endonuclease McrA